MGEAAFLKDFGDFTRSRDSKLRGYPSDMSILDPDKAFLLLLRVKSTPMKCPVVPGFAACRHRYCFRLGAPHCYPVVVDALFVATVANATLHLKTLYNSQRCEDSRFRMFMQQLLHL